MNTIEIKNTNLIASEIVLGCMRTNSLSKEAYTKLIEAALECNINFFDHADIYGGGECETIFGYYLGEHKGIRDKIYVQSKCGIRKGYYDQSKEHMTAAVDGILKRLKTDYLDSLLIHRPDALMEPEEIAEVFDSLKNSGKVKNFGVSNFNPQQIDLLKKYVNVPLAMNQLQLSVTNCSMVDRGINVNTIFDTAVDRDGGILDYCRLNDITIQAWSPFLYGFFDGIFIDNPKFPELNECLNKIGQKYGVSSSAISAAWILRHSAKIQVIIGTTNDKRLKDICTATNFRLTREEWYEIYRASLKKIP